MNNGPEVLIPKEVAERLRISEAFTRRACKDGSIPGAFSIGSSRRPVWRIKRLIFEEWFQSPSTASSVSSAKKALQRDKAG